MFKKPLVIVLMVIVVIAVLGGIFWLRLLPQQNKQVACTMEAKLCPDGSSVGRSGPNCEFAACPELSKKTNTDNWKTFTDAAQGVSFKYPEKLEADFTSTVDWQPTIKVSNDAFTCNAQTGAPTSPDRSAKTINNQNYCIEAMSEGAAGSTYTTYTYTTTNNNKLVSLTFTLRYPQCMNYDDPQQTACLNERRTFDLDSLADKMLSSLVLTKADLIKVSYPVANQIIISPLTVTGQARGNWFFEASFPVQLTDANGKEIVSGIAQAKSDWMTNDFVPFEAKFNFAKPQTSTGFLILKKDNPSGLPAKDDSLKIPVNFQ